MITPVIVPIIQAAPAKAQKIEPRTAISLQMRATSAAQQKQNHEQFLLLKSEKSKLRGVLSEPPTVGIDFSNIIQTSSTIFYYDDMEHGTNGWTIQTSGDTTLWHQTTFDANSPTHSWWCGIDSQKNYNTGKRVSQGLVSPMIDLSGASGSVTMMFTENYFTEAGWDFCMVDVSTDGGTQWTHLRGGYATSPSGDSYGWKIMELNLTPYAGKKINIRFLFDTGDAILNDFTGWFIDNVVVYDQSGIIVGKIYLDMNQNGVRDHGEWNIGGMLIVSGPITLTINSGGSYSVPLPLGSYTVSQVLESPWTQTSSPDTFTIDLTTSGQTLSGLDFGDYRPGTFIRGIIFDDLNRDGILESSDSLLPGWGVDAYDSIGTRWIQSANSDDSGQFTLFVTHTGHYIVKEFLPFDRGSTVPGGSPPEYIVDVPRLDTVLDGFLFGNYRLPVGTVLGTVFNDMNRNAVRDSGETGMLNWEVSLGDSSGRNEIDVLTDSAGLYQITNVPIGVHIVQIYDRKGWKKSLPSDQYRITVEEGHTVDSLNFGEYALVPGSISGAVFNDLNGNGVRDLVETSIAGAEVHLGGHDYYGSYVAAVVVTDDSGRYRIGGLLAGSYQVRLAISSHWRQTYPSRLQGYQIDLGDEQNLAPFDFGLMRDSLFNVAYRSFLPESISHAGYNIHRPGKAIKPVAYESEATFDLVVPTGGMAKLHAEFSQKITPSTLTITHFPPSANLTQPSLKWDFALPTPDTLVTGEHVVIFAQGDKGKTLIMTKYWWIPDGIVPHWKPAIVRNTGGQGRLLFPMPNAINVLDNLFAIGIPAPGIVVGVYGPHSVYHKSSSDVYKSFHDKHDMHFGPPRCLGMFANNLKPIKKAVETLSPTNGNNILFAEALALKVNIQSSNFAITPFGFGDLIFQDTIPNPLSGYSIRKIAAKLDTALSAFDPRRQITTTDQGRIWIGGDTCLCDSNTFKAFYRTIRMIDTAFSAPFDTSSFATGLVVSPAREISAVPYLHIDSSFTTIACTEFQKPVIPEMPRQFILQQNYPNPFNPSTTIEFYLIRSSVVTMNLYNTLGQEVATLLNRQSLDGGWNQYTMSADAFRLASGVYYYRLIVETVPDDDNPISQKVTMVKKMLYLK